MLYITTIVWSFSFALYLAIEALDGVLSNDNARARGKRSVMIAGRPVERRIP